ncbi:MAG: alpha/beta hydrolase fold domain-containing protein [Solobacterium sp.]|nr:alpha/beta hydrolase fold domain-containing protein [Solobacterium sp.]
MAKIQCNVISYVLRRTVDLTVVVPTPTIPQSMGMGMKEGETPKHTPKAPYPVLYLLHGVGNNHAQWTGYTNVEMYAEEHQIVVVNMSAENKGYITAPGGDDYFRFISEELPDFITGMFPVSKRPEDTYIAGLSMGGAGTIIHALNFPERFRAFGAFSAAVGNLQRRSGPAIEREDRFVPEKLVEKIKAEGGTFPKAYMACGTADFLYENDKEFCKKLVEAGADVTWDEIEGYGHEWRFWDIQIEKFLKWIPRTDAYADEGPRKI